MTTTVDPPILHPISEDEALTFEQLEQILTPPAPPTQGELFEEEP